MEHVHLLGSEDVRAGGNAIERGGERISSAAGMIDEAARRIESAAQTIADAVRRLEDLYEAQQRVERELARPPLPDPTHRAG